MGEPELVRFKSRRRARRPRYVEHAEVFAGADGTGEVTGLKPLTSDPGCVKVYVDRVQVARVAAEDVAELGLAKGAAWTGALAGRRLVEAKLRRDGVSAEIIRAVLDEAFGERDQREDAMELARRQAGTLVRLDRVVAERRLIGRLARRGFDAEVVRECARRALDEAMEGEACD